jgi:hypothetical protein
MGKYKYIVLMGFMFLLGKASAQDPHFSQFFSSPLTLNPAFTGKFFGAYRVMGNYRNQWPTINNAFTTATFAADFSSSEISFPLISGVSILFKRTDNRYNGEES